MFTNRDEVLEKALRIFAKMNYEKASQMEIAKTCGLSKAGLVYYFPFKLDLFKAVVDKYVFDTQHSKNKFNFTANSLSEFIDQYVAEWKTRCSGSYTCWMMGIIPAVVASIFTIITY